MQLAEGLQELDQKYTAGCGDVELGKVTHTLSGDAACAGAVQIAKQVRAIQLPSENRLCATFSSGKAYV